MRPRRSPGGQLMRSGRSTNEVPGAPLNEVGRSTNEVPASNANEVFFQNFRMYHVLAKFAGGWGEPSSQQINEVRELH